MNEGKTRRYCFTWNNYPVTALDQLRDFYNSRKAVYMIVGKEIGANGTPHLQGYIQFVHQIKFEVLKSKFPQVHWEKARGNAEQNKIYCSKEQDFFEMGTCPKNAGQSSKESWTEILRYAEKGDWDWLKENHPRIWVTMSEKLISKRIPATDVIDGDIQNEWWYGATGTGKSKLAWEKYGKICFQKMLNKWWDGYCAEPVVVIKEWSPKNEVTASALKIWADRYPFTAQIKGGVLQKIRPKKIIVLSNYRISDCFPDNRDAEPLLRRFKELHFPDDKQLAEYRANALLNELEQAKSNDDIAEIEEAAQFLQELASESAADTSAQATHDASIWSPVLLNPSTDWNF